MSMDDAPGVGEL
jgi:hypothetical protein